MTPEVLANEKAFIGALLRSPEVYWEAKPHIRGEMFGAPEHQILFNTVGELLESGRRVTRTTLEARLPAEYGEGQPFIPLVAVLKENASDAGSALDYADPIRENFARQKIRQAAEAALKACRDITKPAEDILAALEACLMDAMQDQSASTIKSLGQAARDSLAKTAENYRVKGDVQIGLRTGIRELDQLMGPIMGGDLVTIAAPSGHGKTTLALQIMRHAARGDHGKPALLISQEMTSTQIATRVLAAWTEVSVRKQRAGDIDVFQFQSLKEAAEEAEAVRLYIDDCGQQRTSAICSKIRSFHRQHGLGCAAVDHILLVKPENPRWTKVETVEYAAMAFKELAKELDIPIFLLAQLTRGSQDKANSWKFTDQALYGGDAIKQASDVMLGVTLPRKWLKQREPDETDQRAHDEWFSRMERWKDKAEIGALKMRDDDDGQWLTMPFDGATYTFGSAA
jgi:replicative DNA helicase